MKIELKILDDRVKIEDLQPKTAGSAGIDLMAVRFDGLIDSVSDIDIYPFERRMIGAGIAININDPGYAAMILPRSGLGNVGLVLSNTIGLIDSDYQGELIVSLFNRSQSIINISKFQRIAQLIIIPVIRPEFQIVESFAASERGDCGFGSTGL